MLSFTKRLGRVFAYIIFVQIYLSFWLHFLSILLLFGIYSPYIAYSYKLQQNGQMLPTDPYVEAGSTLELNCTISNKDLITKKLDARNLTFFAGKEPVPSHFVTALSPFTARLRFPNISKNLSTIHFFCYFPGVEYRIGQQSVAVGDKPVRPKVRGCKVYNWHSMTCWWDPVDQTGSTGIHTTQELLWTLELPKYYKCNHTGIASCTWKRHDDRNSFKSDLDYFIEVEAHNKFGTAISKNNIINTRIIVQPDPVFLMAENITDSSIDLTWHPPIENKKILYKIFYHDLKLPLSKIQVVETPDLKIKLKNLRPSARYNISIKCIPLIGNKTIGFWSNTTYIIKKMKENVPYDIPKIAPSYFLQHVHKNIRTVRIYWQPIPPMFENGKIMSYLLICKSKDSISDFNLTLKPTELSAELDLKIELEYKIVVMARNRIGFNNRLFYDRLTIPVLNKALPNPKDLVAVKLAPSKKVQLTWNPVKRASGYFIFWCIRLSHAKCKNAIEWRNVSANQHQVELAINEQNYIFSISAYRYSQGSLLHSSMSWSDHDCIYSSDKKILPPTWKFGSSYHKGELIINFDSKRCVSGYVKQYNITYWRDESFKRSLIIPSTRDSYTLKGLTPGALYHVEVFGQSSFGQSQTSLLSGHATDSMLKSWHIVLIVLFCLIAIIFLFIGLMSILRRIKKKFKEYSTIVIQVPPELSASIKVSKSDDGYDTNIEQTDLLLKNSDNIDKQLRENNSDSSTKNNATSKSTNISSSITFPNRSFEPANDSQPLLVNSPLSEDYHKLSLINNDNNGSSMSQFPQTPNSSNFVESAPNTFSSDLHNPLLYARVGTFSDTSNFVPGITSNNPTSNIHLEKTFPIDSTCPPSTISSYSKVSEKQVASDRKDIFPEDLTDFSAHNSDLVSHTNSPTQNTVSSSQDDPNTSSSQFSVNDTSTAILSPMTDTQGYVCTPDKTSMINTGPQDCAGNINKIPLSKPPVTKTVDSNLVNNENYSTITKMDLLSDSPLSPADSSPKKAESQASNYIPHNDVNENADNPVNDLAIDSSLTPPQEQIVSNTSALPQENGSQNSSISSQHLLLPHSPSSNPLISQTPRGYVHIQHLQHA